MNSKANVLFAVLVIGAVTDACSDQKAQKSSLEEKRIHEGAEGIKFFHSRGRATLWADLLVYEGTNEGSEPIIGGHVDYDVRSGVIYYVNLERRNHMAVGKIDYEKGLCLFCDGEFDQVCDLDLYPGDEQSVNGRPPKDRAVLTLKDLASNPTRPTEPDDTDADDEEGHDSPPQPTPKPNPDPTARPPLNSDPADALAENKFTGDLFKISEASSFMCAFPSIEGASFAYSSGSSTKSLCAFASAIPIDVKKKQYIQAKLRIKASGQNFSLRLVGFGQTAAKSWSSPDSSRMIDETINLEIGKSECLKGIPAGTVGTVNVFVYSGGNLKIEKFATTDIRVVSCSPTR